MGVCRVCGQTKPEQEFRHVHHFTKYKKHNVFWCKDCQKMWMTMKKEQELEIKRVELQKHQEIFLVTFE